MLRLTLEPFVPDSMEVTEVGHHTSSIVTSIRALCRLHRHFLRIPELSFLPEPERDRGDLARQRDFGQFLADAVVILGSLDIVLCDVDR